MAGLGFSKRDEEKKKTHTHTQSAETRKANFFL